MIDRFLPEGPDRINVEAVLLLTDRGEPLLHLGHVGLLVGFSNLIGW